MAKTFSATWLGDGDPSAQIIYVGGVRFVKGDKVSVPVDIAENGVPMADVIRSNPTFACEDDPDVPDPSDAEIEAMKAELDRRGIKYRSNIAGAKLRDLLADTEPDPAPTPPPTVTTPSA